MVQKNSQGEENIVFIGMKPFMNYIKSVNKQLSDENTKEIILKARGKTITRAVDVAEVVKKTFKEDKEIYVKEIKIDSEECENKEGKKVNVSTIEIILKKK
jgi:archaea-specific DNA-binding protein